MRSDTFAALRYRDFRLLYFGQLISQSGTQMQRIAIAWHVYLLTHDAIALGLIGVVRVLPVLLFSLFGGMVADAQDRRRVMLVTQSTMALAAALLAFATFADFVNVPLIYTLVFASARSMGRRASRSCRTSCRTSTWPTHSASTQSWVRLRVWSAQASVGLSSAAWVA